jgi:hypothetical protein
VEGLPAWRGIEFDCRFFDPPGNLIDAGNGQCSFTAEPFDETAVRIAVQPMAPTNDYAGFQLLVNSARNAAGRP